MTRVLVLDGSQRKSLAAVRSLAVNGYEAFVADSRAISLAGSSRFARGRVRLPSPTSAGYLEALSSATASSRIDVVLPTDDHSMGALAGSTRIGRAALLAPSAEAFRYARDKGATAELAARCHVAIPRTGAPADEMDIARIVETFPLPALVKPREGSGARGIVYAEDRAALRSAYRSVHERWPFPLVQEWIRPVIRKVHVAMLSLDGRVLASFTQEVLREWPVRGGVGTLWRSIRDDAAIESTRRLVEGSRFTGVTLTEYLYTHETGPILMEVNPRFWNTLALSIACGVDFPTLWVAAALGHPREGPAEWPVGRLAQWLVPGDLLNFIFNHDRLRQPIGYLPFGARVHAIWRRDDPLPMLAMLAIVAQGMTSPRMWRYALRR
jgi:predicted ATP-grasp superfamily ATP-dependent carboligase